MSIDFNRDATPVVAVKLAEEPTKNTYVIRSEHSHAKPSLILAKRDLPSANSTVRRSSIHRVRGVVLNAGTSFEENANLNLELKVSVPVGTSDSDITSAIQDMVGLLETTAVADLIQIGIMPE